MCRHTLAASSKSLKNNDLSDGVLGGEKENGAQGWNRTSDTRIFSPLLYQLSYLGLCRRSAAPIPELAGTAWRVPKARGL